MRHTELSVRAASCPVRHSTWCTLAPGHAARRPWLRPLEESSSHQNLSPLASHEGTCRRLLFTVRSQKPCEALLQARMYHISCSFSSQDCLRSVAPPATWHQQTRGQTLRWVPGLKLQIGCIIVSTARAVIGSWVRPFRHRSKRAKRGEKTTAKTETRGRGQRSHCTCWFAQADPPARQEGLSVLPWQA